MNDLTTGTEPNWRDWTRREYANSWLPPAVTPEMQAIAKSVLATFPDRMAPAKFDSVKRWLDSLGVFVVGRTDADAIAFRINAYAGNAIDYPAGVFTAASLKRASGEFTFWPAYADLKKFLDREQHTLRMDQHRLTIIANHQPKPKSEEIDRGPEARARWDAAMKGFMQSIGKPWDPEATK